MTQAAQAKAPKVTYDVPEELADQIREIYEFINKHRDHIDQNYQRWLDPQEAAAYLRVSAIHLVRNMKEEINFSRRGRVIVFDRKDLDAFWEKRKKN